MKKALAIIIALAIAMALSISAFAADSGSVTVNVTEEDNWWHQQTFYELTGELTDGHETLTVSATEGEAVLGVLAGYNNAAGEWTSTDGDALSFTLDLADVSGDVHVIVRAAAGDYTIEWAFDADAAAPAEENEPEAAEPEPTEPEATPEPVATPEPAAPATGIALAAVPAVMALAAVAVTKRR